MYQSRMTEFVGLSEGDTIGLVIANVDPGPSRKNGMTRNLGQ